MFIKRFWGLRGWDVCPGTHVAAQGGEMTMVDTCINVKVLHGC